MRLDNGWLVVICFAASALFGVCSASAREIRSPGYEDERLLYKKYSAELQSKLTFKGLPLYAVKVNSHGTGHLQSYIASADGFPRAKAQSTLTNQEGVFTDWEVRTSFLGDKGWTLLSLDGAKELWEDPRRHTLYDQHFYTFDSHSLHVEENIYHIDLRFGSGKLLEAYRVRGIGISNPMWVTKKDVNRELRWVSTAEAQVRTVNPNAETPAATEGGNIRKMRLTDECLTKESLSYREYQDELLNLEQKAPSAFTVIVDEFSIGHIYPSCIASFEYPRKTPQTSEPGGRFSKWNDIMTFLKLGKGWAILNLGEAECLWGKPRIHRSEGGDFYTFDAQSQHGEEPNIYHLDFKVDSEEQVTAYRIRGIGIRHPQWIDEKELAILQDRIISRHEQRRKAAAQGKWLEFDEHDRPILER